MYIKIKRFTKLLFVLNLIKILTSCAYHKSEITNDEFFSGTSLSISESEMISVPFFSGNNESNIVKTKRSHFIQPEMRKINEAIYDVKTNANSSDRNVTELIAPAKYHHPLRATEKLSLMLGEDNRGYYLYAEGPIEKNAYKKFLKYIDHYQSIGIYLNRLMMHSPGGLLNEGIKIGNYIKKNNWSTDLDKYMKCYSSCGFIYMAGNDKYMQDGAELGFHRPYIKDEKDSIQIIEKLYNSYLPYWKRIHGSQALYDFFMKNYGRDDMYRLDTKSAGRYMSVRVY